MSQGSPFETLIGTDLGNYHLEYLLEQHKWGPIFLATGKMGKSYVVRFIGDPSIDELTSPAPDSRIVYLGRFQQEANQVAVVQHPYILPLLDYGNYHGMPYLVYPYVHMTSLAELLQKHKNQTDLLAVGRYLDQIATALEYAHEHAVLHRNLSAHCVCFHQYNRQIIVTEFGLMRMHELSKRAIRQTEMGEEGYVGYTYDGSSETSSPEQLLGKTIDVAADVYALGAILYYLITGHNPFIGKTPQEVARQHLYAQVPSTSIWRPGVPADIDHIIKKAMAKEPELRFQRPSALVEAYYQRIGLNEVPHSTQLTAGNIAEMRRSNAIRVSRPSRGSSALNVSGPIEKEKATVRIPFPELKDLRNSVDGQYLRKIGVSMYHEMKHFSIMSRRRLLALIGGVFAAVVALFVGEHVLFSSGTPSSGIQPGTVLAQVNDVPVNTAKTFPLVNQPHPGVLIHLPDHRFVAFNSTCTHSRCAVSYNTQNHLLSCPCHGSTFDPARNAAVVQGPATAPLKQIKVIVNSNGTVTTE